jgi:hypothetical protein
MLDPPHTHARTPRDSKSRAKPIGGEGVHPTPLPKWQSVVSRRGAVATWNGRGGRGAVATWNGRGGRGAVAWQRGDVERSRGAWQRGDVERSRGDVERSRGSVER